MTKEELDQMESSQRQDQNVRFHNERMWNENERRIYQVIQELNCTISKDGDEWCCLYGADLQVGVCGFGKTPHEACVNFGTTWGIA